MSEAELGEIERALEAIRKAVGGHSCRAISQACLTMVAHLLVESASSLEDAESGAHAAVDVLSLLVRVFWEADRAREAARK